MNENCELFRDLYDLYKDGICSKDSEDFIETHLNECEECRKLTHAKRDNVPVVSKEKKVLEKIKKRISSKVAAIICFVLAVAALPFFYIGFFMPEVFMPPCIIVTPEVSVMSSADHLSDDDMQTIIKELKKTMRTNDHFDGSVLNEIKLYTSFMEMKNHNTFPYKEYEGVTFEEEIMLECKVHYYMGYGARLNKTKTMLFGAALLDGEWIIFPLEVHF